MRERRQMAGREREPAGKKKKKRPLSKSKNSFTPKDAIIIDSSIKKDGLASLFSFIYFQHVACRRLQSKCDSLSFSPRQQSSSQIPTEWNNIISAAAAAATTATATAAGPPTLEQISAADLFDEREPAAWTSDEAKAWRRVRDFHHFLLFFLAQKKKKKKE